MQPQVPIIVLNWNGIQDTLECLQSLSGQSYPNFIVYLVDNGSGAEDVRLLKEHFSDRPDVRLVFNKKNLGFTKGNNAVLREIIAPGNDFKYVALLNNDTAVDRDWLGNLVRCAQETGAGMVASKMVNYFDRRFMDNAGHLMLNTAEIIPIGHAEPVGHFTERKENMGSCAGATLYSVEMLRRIGVFDEYFETGYEDAELGVRAVVTGHTCVYEPTAVVYHKISQSVKKVLDYRYLLKIQLNIFYSYFKLMPTPVLLVNLPSFLFKYGAVLLIDIVFVRIRFLKIMCHAIWLTAVRERKTIVRARRDFHAGNRTASSWAILSKQTFFLWFDIKRFFKYVVLRRPTTFEKY